MNEAVEAKREPTKFGTFGGVFTPCTLTIFGVIMFLRYGHVVGQAGVFGALQILLLAKAITILTTLSLSAIATNAKVRGGGAYYLISRSLGVEFGGAIGIVFFVAQAISVSLYVIGFTEAFVAVFPAYGDHTTGIASLVNIAVFLCVFIGAGWTVKLQYGILVILALSLVSFFLGAANSFDTAQLADNWESNFTGAANWFSMFALFFPAVTGIMAGANMSGDLADPGRSIPRGTLVAIVVTGVVYAVMAVFLGAATTGEVLTDDRHVVRHLSYWPLLITAGVFAATLSSALGSMMGAPRILQAFAKDDIFQSIRFLGKGSGKNEEPRRAVFLTFMIAEVCILLGDLDIIAPIITMAFLITYGTINLATFYEGVTKNPSYRPRFKYSHWVTSLLGALGCLFVMFLNDWVAAVGSIIGMALLHWAIGTREVEARWGDLQGGLIFERTRRNLLKLESYLHHPKNWRPIILALSGSGWSRPQLAVYGHWFTAGHGILSLGQVIAGGVGDRVNRLRAQEKILGEAIEREGLEAFPAVTVAESVASGIENLVQCHGLGSLRPNTVLLGWPSDPDRVEDFGATIRTLAALERSIIAVRTIGENDDPWRTGVGTIDIWWRGERNGALMVLLAHLLTKNTGWRNRVIRLLRVIPNDAGREDVHRHLQGLIETARIRAVAQTIVDPNPIEAIPRESRHAAIVFLGFEAPAEGQERDFWERLEAMALDLPNVVFVDSIGDMSLE